MKRIIVEVVLIVNQEFEVSTRFSRNLELIFKMTARDLFTDREIRIKRKSFWS